MSQDLLFDVDALVRQAVAATRWEGPAPLAYTTSYHLPDDLDAAYDRWIAEHGHLGCDPRSHMWHRAIAQINPITGSTATNSTPTPPTAAATTPTSTTTATTPNPSPAS